MFFPPSQLVVDSTILFSPPYLYELNRFAIVTVIVSPLAMSVVIRPQSLRNVLSAAVRIHTMKCSSLSKEAAVSPEPPRVATSSLKFAGATF
jgi:hypothetical protein